MKIYALIKDFEKDKITVHQIKRNTKQKAYEHLELYLLNSDKQGWIETENTLKQLIKDIKKVIK